MMSPAHRVLAVALMAMACGESAGNDPSRTDETTAPGVEEALVCPPEAETTRGLTHDTTRRLSRDELALTLRDLLGDEIFEQPAIADRIAGLPSDRIQTPGDFAQTPPVGLPGVLFQVAREVAETAGRDPDWRRDWLHVCAETLPIADDCVENVVVDWGARVWRRPLTDDEVDDYLAFHDDLGGGEIGFEALLRRLLQSPSLVFHFEDGTDETDHGRRRLSDHEVASRIAYLTTGGPPDATLFDAAATGALTTVDDARREVQRLLDSETSRQRVEAFFRFYTALPDLPDPPANVALHAGVDPEGLGAALTDEAITFFDALVYGDGTYVDLMTSTEAYPPTDAAANVLGTSATGPVVAPDHPGLLHRPALLMTYGERTSPILRGAHLRKLFLCDDLGLPDPVAVEAAQEELGDTSAMTNREAVTALTADAACAGCHALVNPLGFVFEGYDQIGVVRTEEALLDEQGGVVRTFPIDTRVTDIPLVEPEPISVDDSNGFAQVMAHSAKARQCLSRRLFEYVHRDAWDPERDTCLVHDIDEAARDATLRDALVASIANADLFWKEDPR